MPFDFAALKQTVRQQVHDTLAVSVVYSVDGVVVSDKLTARWHDKLKRFGDLDNEGYAEVLEGIDRVVFDRGQLATEGVTLERGGEVLFVAYGIRFELDSMEPHDGPVNEAWQVTKL